MAVASKNAIVNVGRLNAFRLNYIQPGLRQDRDATLAITLNGAPLRVRLGSLQIHDVINDAPNTASLTVDDATPPTVGGRLKVVLGVDPKYTLFVGTLQAARQSYVGRAHADVWACEAIDDTARADWLRPFGAWGNPTSATEVAQFIINNFCPGYSFAGVQAGLPAVTLFLDGTERVNGALRLLAKLIGGYYYFEDYVLHLFQGDEPGANPDDVTGAQLLEAPRLEAASDDAQIRTRCYGKGHAEATLADVNAGQTTIPIGSTVMFLAGGGEAISEWQRITYTGTVHGGEGALVGPGVTPSAPPTVALAAGTGVEAGSHAYAYTWLTAAGETLPSPLASITTGDTPTPTTAPTIAADLSTWSNQAGHVVGDTLRVATCFSGDISCTIGVTPLVVGASMVVPAWNGPGNNPAVIKASLASFVRPSALAAFSHIFVSKNGGTYLREYTASQNIGVPVGTAVAAGSWNLATYTPPYPGANPASRRVALSGVAVGPAGVTSRKIYRSAANLTALKLLTTWSDNTTTTGVDATPDAGLGAAPPASDASGLQQPAGSVLPGAATMPVASTAWARTAGGWAVIGNGAQVISYSGISGNTITGIPPTGPGAITAAVNFNSTITSAPMLTGVSVPLSGAPYLAVGLAKGAPVNIWVTCNDLAAQTDLAARVGGSGIVEHLIVDERRGVPSLTALCNADLALYGRPIVTVRYTTFDPKSRSGRPVRVHLTQPAIDQTLVIQDVTIATGTGPARFTVTASSVRYALEDLLRRMVGTLEEGF